MSDVIKLPDRVRGVVWQLDILFRDASLLVLNKPAGVAVTADGRQLERGALLPLLHQSIESGKPWAQVLQLQYLMAAHRPEAQTSGVWILARTHEVLAPLADQLRGGVGRLHYLALVRGGPVRSRFELNTRLVAHPERPGHMQADARRGKRCRVRCGVLEQYGRYSLLRCVPTPGRPGQIAAQLRQARHPLVADPDRGGPGLFLSQLKRDYVKKKGQEERPLIGRPALHLETVELRHPVTGEALAFTAPLAKDFAVALKYLRRYGQARSLPT